MQVIDRQLNYGRHHVRRFVRGERMETVLDLGAGHGDDLGLARDAAPSAALHAIEPNEGYARELEAQGIAVHRLDLERASLPFADGTVDLVIANQILEHVKEIFWIFHEIARVTRVGGVVIVGVPNLASLHNRLLLLLGRQPTAIQTASAHVRGYTRRDLLRFLDIFPGGFSVDDSGGSNFYPFPPVLARPLAALMPEMAAGIFLKLRKRRNYRGEFAHYPVSRGLETNYFVGQPDV